VARSNPPRQEEFEAILTLLREGALDIQCPARFGSNCVYYTFVSDERQLIGGVYKPVKGEITLYDFPKGTLAGREVAAFLVSEALGWHFVPPTVYRSQAPDGPGALQLYIPTPPDFYHIKFNEQDLPALQRVALFDLLTNNADRKPAHLLAGNPGEVWSIDHGLCFHQQFALRTFLWEFEGKPIPQNLLNDVANVQQRLGTDRSFIVGLSAFLTPTEVSALRRRVDKLLTERRYVSLR
jgi:uncharacterized repeat protein (TIGR03843 family)